MPAVLPCIQSSFLNYTPVYLFPILTAIGIAILYYYSKLWQGPIKLPIKILKSLLFLLATFVISVIGLFVFIIFMDGLDNPASHKYQPLNAAIKNTCYLDPEQNHCPQTYGDLIAIEPERFTQMVQDSYVTYEYRPQTNQYTLIIIEGWGRGVIYDPRLENAQSQHGYGDGFDFVDIKVNVCHSPPQILNPPPFPGLWSKLTQ